jgi:DNA-binding beta-propeller fold protein YncE
VLALCARALPAPVGAADAPRADVAPPLELTQTIPLPEISGGVNHLAVDADKHRVFITSTKDAELVVVDLSSKQVIRRLKGPSPAAAEFAPDARQLIVSRGSQVVFHDGDTFELLGAADLGSHIDELHYDARTQRLYAGCMDAGKTAIAIVDRRTRSRVGDIKLPGRPQGFQIDSASARVYANCPSERAVIVGDLEKQTAVDHWPLGDFAGNYPMALDQKGHRLFVACRKPAKLLMLDTRNGQRIAAVDITTDADDMAYDALNRRVYVCGGEGTVSVIRQADADTYEALPPVKTTDGARNGVWSPGLSLFFVAAPMRDSQKAELRVYQVPQTK